MDEPSIKGVILLRSWRELNSLIEEGRIPREHAEARLDPRCLEILDQKVEPVLWYPLAAASSFAEIVDEVVGGEGPPIWIERGRTVADNILENPHIAAFFDDAMKHGESAGAVMVKMSSLLLDFGEMRFEGKLRDFRIPFEGSGRLPEIVRHTLHGVIQAFAERAIGAPYVISSSRDGEGNILYSGRVAD